MNPDQPKGKRTPEIPDNQLDQASGGVGTNQLWGRLVHRSGRQSHQFGR